MAHSYRKRLLFVLILGVLFLSQTVFADEKAEQKDRKSPYNLEEIPVTDKKAGEPVTSPYAVPESAKISTEIFTKEDIQAIHPQTVYDVLSYAPGLNVTFQGRRSLNHLSSRGGGMDTVGIILDGVYMPIGTATRILATIPTDDIESITVMRDSSILTMGPLMGFNAHGSFATSLGASDQGFVVIRTKRASAFETGATVGYGSYATSKENIYTGNKIKQFDYRLSFTHQETDGQTDWYNASHYNSLMFHGGYTGKAISVDVFADVGKSEREFQRGLLSNGDFANAQRWSYDDMWSAFLGVNVTKPWGESQTTNFTYCYSRVDDDLMLGSFAYGGNTSVPDTSYNEKDYLQGFSLGHIIKLGNNILKVGGQVYYWYTPTGEFSYSGTSTSDGKRRDEELYGVYLYDEHHFLDDRLIIDGGARVDKKYIENGIESDGIITATASTNPKGVTTVTTTSNPTEDTWTDPVLTFALGAAYKLTPIYKLTGRLSYSQQNSDSFFFTKDDLDYILEGKTGSHPSDLPTEKRYRYEAGIKATYHPAFNPYVTFFLYDIQNSRVAATLPSNVKVVDSTGNTVSVVDAQDVRLQGVEIGLSGYISQIPLSYYLNYAYIDNSNELAYRGMANYTWSARLQYQHKMGFEANFLAKHVSAYGQNVTEKGQGLYYEMGDYTRIDANVAYNFKVFGTGVRIMVYGQNLTDEHYVTRYNAGAYQDAGAVFGTELSIKL